MIPYEQITETADRRWTCRLLDRLNAADLPEDELDDLVGALQAVSDPRSFGPLEAMLCDAFRPERIRKAASSALRGMHFVALDPPPRTLRRWWHEGDFLLRRHALLCMDGLRCPDVVLAVASDPTHPLQALALLGMEFWFDRPEHEAVKIAALGHPDPTVRRHAAYVLLWDEPIAAEGPLVGATADPVPEVAVEAVNTLKYYPSRRTIRCLHRLLSQADGKVRDAADQSFAEVRGRFLDGLRSRDRRVAERVRAWLRPVWGMLTFTDEELRPDKERSRSAFRERTRAVTPLAEVLDLLRDPDASPRVLQQKLGGNDWRSYGPEERGRLRPVLLSHPDAMVRDSAAGCLAAWRDVGGLVTLAEDPSFGVRKAAMYHLGTLPPAAGVAELAWDHLQRTDSLGVHATETLNTFARQATSEVAAMRLAAVAADSGRLECLRVAAVEGLARLGAAGEISQLAGLLQEPPAVTWALHLALLAAITKLSLRRPGINHLRGVDNLDVLEAVARFDEDHS